MAVAPDSHTDFLTTEMLFEKAPGRPVKQSGIIFAFDHILLLKIPFVNTSLLIFGKGCGILYVT